MDSDAGDGIEGVRMTSTAARPGAADGFRHEALLYAGEAEFVERAVSFIRAGLDAEEPILVVVGSRKIELLRGALDVDVDSVLFADMLEVGRNPARIIPAWRDFVSGHAGGGRRLRGIGEPVWAGRSPAELVECQRHESLLNLGFATTPAWWLLCPYDTAALDPQVIDEALRSHPLVMDGAGARRSVDYRGLQAAMAPFDAPLPEPPADSVRLDFDAGPLAELRAVVARHAAGAGLDRTRTQDLVLAVHEVASNSLRHAGGRGSLRMWCDADGLACEIRDAGKIEDPLVGRERPSPSQPNGRGLWLANQLCDLVQLRSFSSGTAVRLRMSLPS